MGSLFSETKTVTVRGESTVFTQQENPLLSLIASLTTIPISSSPKFPTTTALEWAIRLSTCLDD